MEEGFACMRKQEFSVLFPSEPPQALAVPASCSPSPVALDPILPWFM